MNSGVHAQVDVRRFLDTFYPKKKRSRKNWSKYCLPSVSEFEYSLSPLQPVCDMCVSSRSASPGANIPPDNPVNHFPTYEPSQERIDAIQASLAEENNPLNIHYDASKEVRAKGAGFYQFSGDAETRRSQMEELKNARDETGKTRQEFGAVDLRPGEMEGMGTDAVPQKSRALEKRKRELEERRRLLEAKRRKKDPGSGTPEPTDEIPVFSMPPDPLQGQPEHPPDHSPHNTSQEPADPFAVLEVKASSRSGKGKQTTRPINDADAFLASLEQDMLGKRSR